ncbi:phage terminase large subunit [Saccharibacter floricola]|uniref:Phage terminase large subunit N-terminal domain-containing protein n=1 Tax=Saccharibacter floricola DSM 15669 TaxID=1123227 RepID=A0ABQ0NZV2_9PROT|nr:phage terminase large subunit [Saccharibacter floricola]GBQ07477.1 hypothetical protein AA15669_1394 [Saccharibacter floricola DSM 15669]
MQKILSRCREYQNSMADSMHKLLSDQIDSLGLAPWFTVLENAIRAHNGSEFLFKGLARNIQSIKSTEGVDIAWVEEAQTLSQESIELLLPTIRKEGSEVWFTWNPLEEGSPIEKLRESLAQNPEAFIGQINWSDNPWLPEALNKERLRCYETDPESYDHIWEGGFRRYGQAFFSIDATLTDKAPVPLPSFCDCVYAVMDTTLKGGMGNDGTGVVYIAFDRFNHETPLFVLDWDIVEVEGSMLEDWVPVVMERLETLARDTHARHGSIGLHIEDKAAGSVIIPQLQRRGLNVHAIESRLTSMGKDQRALDVSSPVQQGRIKITEPAFEKTTIFRGQSKNHFLSQVFGFRLNDKDAARRADDLLDCFCYGIAVGLGDTMGG